MQVSIQTTSGLERKLTVGIPAERVDNEVNVRLQKASKTVRLDGFRPGKVPMKEVRRRFGPSVRGEVAGETMQNTFIEAVQQESLAPAGNPSLEVVKMDPGIDFEFTATFEVFPNVELADFGGLAVKRPEAEIGRDYMGKVILEAYPDA